MIHVRLKVYKLSKSDNTNASAGAPNQNTVTKATGRRRMEDLGNTFTGFHAYSYPEEQTVCTSDAATCSNVKGAHKNNYFVCGKCRLKNWYTSLIHTFQKDDEQRHDARLRLKLKEPLPVHSQIKKLFKEFRQKGGKISVARIPAKYKTAGKASCRKSLSGKKKRSTTLKKNCKSCDAAVLRQRAPGSNAHS